MQNLSTLMVERQKFRILIIQQEFGGICTGMLRMQMLRICCYGAELCHINTSGLYTCFV